MADSILDPTYITQLSNSNGVEEAKKANFNVALIFGVSDLNPGQ